MSLDQYFHLGRSGLRVSRLALGTMTFGNGGIRGIGGAWGNDEATARGIFDRYIAAGGNFLDTADSYGGGASETLLGRFVAESGLRDRVVIASKFSNSLDPGNPNAGGNGRKNILRAVEASLRRLGTDYLDLYLLHTWDRITPAEEIIRTLDDLVRAGKVRYAGLSDVPGWYAARALTWAEAHALAPPVCLQLPYSLVDRGIEAEFVPLAQTLGLGLTCWSPLAMGLLSGKYAAGTEAAGRLAKAEGMGYFTARNARIVAALQAVAEEAGQSMSRVALNWLCNRPGVAAAIVGARRTDQIEDNLGALGFALAPEQIARLDAASAPEPFAPYSLFTPDYQAGVLNAGTTVGDKPPGYAPPVLMPRRDDYAYHHGSGPKNDG